MQVGGCQGTQQRVRAAGYLTAQRRTFGPDIGDTR
jgi:hypothetical protein